ncbi:hypothetical protein CP970_43000 [Streptomyces kanamyceticus]|uniref:Uncharacterized protein n=1 Tax=Streptomyces kanamyceticus TaxID=1967 RepID=A0A5J6GR10_STRKN|nr:hypothetical protein CP970_43000 [Streptomyces kanamyceticus]
MPGQGSGRAAARRRPPRPLRGTPLKSLKPPKSLKSLKRGPRRPARARAGSHGPARGPAAPPRHGDSPDRPSYAPHDGAPTEPTGGNAGGVSRRTLLFAGLGVAAAATAGAVVLTRRDDSSGGKKTDKADGADGADGADKKDPGKNPGDTSDTSASKGSVALKGLNSVRALAFSADGNTLCGTGSNGICRWDVTSTKGTPVHIGMPGYLQPTVISRDLQYVVRAEENKIRVWNTENGKLIRTFTGPGKAGGQDGWATDVTISPDGGTVVAATTKGLYVWEVSSGKRLAVRKDSEGGPVAFRSDGKMLVAGRPLRLRNPTGVPTATVKDSENAAVGAFSPDGELLAYADQSGPIHVWNTGSNQETVTLDNPDSMIHALAFHPAGDLLASGGQDGTVRVWSRVTGKKVSSFKGPTSVEALAFSPDGKWLAAGLMSAVHYSDKDAVLLWTLT